MRPLPEGPRYEDDFYAWTQSQAELLRKLRIRDNRFDRQHLAAEIEDLGKSERDAVRRQVRRVLVDFLKLAHSPARDPRFRWMSSIVDARAQIADKLSSSLQCDADGSLNRLYAAARKQAALELEEYGESAAPSPLPTECPYSIDEVLTDDWYPARARPEDGDRTTLDQEK